MKITKIAINSQTLRLVFSDGTVKDYNTGSKSSSIMLEFLHGSNFEKFYTANIESAYKSKSVKETDELSWKSESDGSGSINYVDKSDAKPEPRSQRRSSYLSQFSYVNLTPIHRTIPKAIRYVPSRPSFESHNKRTFKKLFGGV